MGLNRALIKKTYSGGEPFSVTAEAATAYADATNAKSARSVLAFCALYNSGWSSATIAASSGYTPPVGYTATLDVNT